MASKSAEKIIDGLTMMLEGFSALEDDLEATMGSEDVGADADDDEFLAAMVAEVRTVIESVIETQEFLPEYIAQVITFLTEALEEIEPEVFSDEAQASAAAREEDDDDGDEESYDDEDE